MAVMDVLLVATCAEHPGRDVMSLRTSQRAWVVASAFDHRSARPRLRSLHDRQDRGLLLPESGPDRWQAGSCFLNPAVTAAQADRLRELDSPLPRPASRWLWR